MTEPSPTVLDRLLAAAASPTTAPAPTSPPASSGWTAQVADGPDHPAPPPSRVVIDGAG